MAASVKLAAKQCPGSKVVMSGFSQGAQVTHKAAELLDQSLYSVVGAIVLFGKSDCGREGEWRVLIRRR
jgi:cutinase